MSFWDKVAGLYDLAEWTNHRVYSATVRRVTELVPQWSSVLECGAGTGEFSLAAARRAGAVLCTDLSEEMLSRAERKAKRRGLQNISFLVRDATELPEGNGMFEVVIAANLLHLLPQPERALSELWRVTAPGGRLILPTFLLGEASAVGRALVAGYRRLGFSLQREFTLASYREFLLDRELPAQVVRIPGRVPVGLAVCEKPAR